MPIVLQTTLVSSDLFSLITAVCVVISMRLWYMSINIEVSSNFRQSEFNTIQLFTQNYLAPKSRVFSQLWS